MVADGVPPPRIRFDQHTSAFGVEAMQDADPVLTVLQDAISNEIAGQRFYDDAASYCIDLWAKETFAALAREEEEHTRLLLIEYEALSKHGHWIDLETARTSDAEVDVAILSFQDKEATDTMFALQGSVTQTVDRMADDLDALALGIRMEQMAIDLYDQQVRTADNPGVREIYAFLVQEEIRHHRELKSQWERLAGTSYKGV
jgi:rubrerythrin